MFKRVVKGVAIAKGIEEPIEAAKGLLRRLGLKGDRIGRACLVWIPFMLISYEDKNMKQRQLCIDSFFINKLASRLNVVFLIRNSMLRYGVCELRVSEWEILPLEYLRPEEVLEIIKEAYMEAERYYVELRKRMKFGTNFYPELVRRLRNLLFIKDLLGIIGRIEHVRNIALKDYVYYPEVLVEVGRKDMKPLMISMGGEVKIDSVYSWLIEKDPLFEKWVMTLINHYHRDDRL